MQIRVMTDNDVSKKSSNHISNQANVSGISKEAEETQVDNEGALSLS
jgi:hypothetical protein